MNRKTTTAAARPVDGTTETTVIHCVVSSVMPDRGDLYVVSTKERDVLVQVDEGIANRPEQVRFLPWKAKQQLSDGAIVALQAEGRSTWVSCHRLYEGMI